jgi:hypothetical protein
MSRMSIPLAAALSLAACQIENTAFQATPDGGGSDLPDVLAIKTSTVSFDVPEGGTAMFTVRLTKAPAGELTIRVKPADVASESEIGLSVPELRFQPTSFDQPQSITVTALTDVDTVDGLANISLTADGVDPVTLTANVRDPDKVDIVTDIASSGVLTINETQSADVHVHLTHKPPADVRVIVTRGPGPVTVVPDQTTFTAANWDKDQSFTFTAPDDVNIVDETQSLTFSATGVPDKLYTIHDLDKDKLNISVTPNQSITVNEGGSTQLSVALTKQPTGNTIVHLDVQLGNVALDHTDLTFTPQNFGTAQHVAVSAPQDVNTVNETDQITLSIPGSNVTPVMIGVSTIDDDVQAILDDAPNPLSVTENQMGSSGVTLKFQPATTMTVTVASLDGNVATATPGTLTFTPQNYNVPAMHQVTVTGTNDNNLATNSTSIRLHEPTLVDVLVPVSVPDDDTQQLVVSPTMLTVPEGMTGTFNVSLKFDPGTTVTVNLANTNQTSLPINKTSITFTGGANGSWSTPSPVTVSPPVDNNAVSETATVTISGGGAPTPVTVALTAMDATVVQNWGWPTPFGSTIQVPATLVVAYKVDVGAAGNLGVFHTYVPTPSGRYRMALYTNASDTPGAFVAEMPAPVVLTAGINDAPSLTNPLLTAPSYFLVIRFENDVNIGRDMSSTLAVQCTRNLGLPNITDDWPKPNFGAAACTNDHLINIWMTTFHQ